MGTLRRVILWATLLAIGLLILFSIVGAFLGQDGLSEHFRKVHEQQAGTIGFGKQASRVDGAYFSLEDRLESVYQFFGGAGAREFFNSTPLTVYWLVLAGMLVAGLAMFRRLLATPAGLAMHLGSLLVLAGAMWGSVQAHDLRTEWWGETKVPSGIMVIYRGYADDQILGDDMRTPLATLPFSLGLSKFSIDYYPADKPWGLMVIVPQPDVADAAATADAADQPAGPPADIRDIIDWKVGQEAPIPHTPVTVKVVQYLPHARPTREGGAEADDASSQPAMQIELACQGRRQRAWLVPEPDESFVPLALDPFIRNVPADEEHTAGPALYLVSSQPDIEAYKSDVVILSGDRTVGQATIEVNHPLHYGGYHFYQVSYDVQHQAYTVLQAVSDSGLLAVYLGFFLVVAGAFWRFWLEPAGNYLFSKQRGPDKT
jgi:hypothetical protein